MITVTRDPISLNDVENLAAAPFVIVGAGENALRIYFESEANKAEYFATDSHEGVNTTGLKKIFSDMAENPDTGSIN